MVRRLIDMPRWFQMPQRAPLHPLGQISAPGS